MTHALLTVVAPLPLERVTDAEQTIGAMDNPARPDIAAKLNARSDDNGTHFASLHAVRSPDGEKAWLAFEFSADGSDDEALQRVVNAIGDHLRAVFSFASDWIDGGDLAGYLRKHVVRPGCGWFGTPGVVFAGTLGMTVGRILKEADLAARVTEIVGALPGSLGALERVRAVREALVPRDGTSRGEAFAWALDVATTDPPFVPPSTAGIVAVLLGSFLKTYLWPAAVIVVASSLLGGIASCWGMPLTWAAAGSFVYGAGCYLLASFGIVAVAIVAAAVAVYSKLRSQEESDWVDDRPPERAVVVEIFGRENRCAQNHMISVTRRKPGAVRWFTSRLVFWAVGVFASKIYRPGFLSDIGTIHFARWITVPGSRDVLFFSNYDASWESYLEDFITRAHAGLTGIWSNSMGFPKSENLFEKGATDGERFKRYARRSMVPTRFWYSAYPSLTTTAIRNNADIRRGLSGVMTEDEAHRWLALFGSAARPASKLVSTEIQSLLFGGLKFMKFGVCLLQRLPDQVKDARTWLRAVLPHVAFNDGRRLGADAIVTLSIGASGLARLGLPDHGLSTFPFAFLEGMTAEYRARILGDRGGAGGKWEWDDRAYDAALLVYGKSAEAVAALAAEIRRAARVANMSEGHSIPLVTITDDKKEPFGFVDGVSQPVIRGTYKGLRNADPIHLVEAGEFILGYPDNRGNMPPGPTLPALDDPENILPTVSSRDDFSQTQVERTRDLGMNGSFLVIRQLEQDVDAFNAYCDAEAQRLSDRLPPPYEMTKEFIAAKMVGRWQDGSSLVRHPYSPQSIEQMRHDANETARPQAKTAAAVPVARATKASRGSDNDFLFGGEDPEGLRCPYGAHIRRANPRDSLDPGSADQIEISNRHRIMRVGRQYVPGRGRNPGLLFMCLNGDIERQFEFVQQTWLMRPSFHGLSCEKDPVLGDAEKGMCSYTIPTRQGPAVLLPMPAFVKTIGGGYFFLPGRTLLQYLAA